MDTRFFTENAPKESKYVVSGGYLYRYTDTHLLRRKETELKEGNYVHEDSWKKKNERVGEEVSVFETIFSTKESGKYVIPSDRLMMFVGNAQRALRKKNVKEEHWGSASVLVYPEKGMIELEWEGVLVGMNFPSQVEGALKEVYSYQFPLFQNMLGNYFKFNKKCTIEVVNPTHSKILYKEGIEGILFHERE